MNIFAIGSLLATVVIIFLGNFVFFRNPKERINKIFFLVCVITGYSSFTDFQYSQSESYERAILWYQIGSFWILVIPSLLQFVLVFPDNESYSKSRITQFLLFFPALVFSIIELTTSHITGAIVKKEWGWTFIPSDSPVNIVFSAWFTLILLLSIFLCFKFFLKIKTKNFKKKQAGLITLGLGVPALFSILALEIFPLLNLNIPDLTGSGISISAILLGYSIWKYRLFNLSPKTAAENIIETISDALLLTDTRGNIKYANVAARELFGLSLADIKVTSINSIIKKIPVDRGPIKELIRNGSLKDFETIFVTKTGLNIPVILSISIMRNDDSKINGVVCIARDISRRKRIEEALRISEEKLRKRNEIMEKDLLNAQQIQKALLHVQIPVFTSLQIDYRYLHVDTVGGDYFSLTPFREGGLGVFIGDVAGHGVHAALYLSLLKATTDRVCRKHARQPGEYIESLNSILYDNMPYSFLTAIYGYFQTGENRGEVIFTFSKGGHPAPLLVRASGEISLLNSSGRLIGMFENIKNEEITVSLKKKDRVFLYTDGLPEALNRDGDIFGYDEMTVMAERANRMQLSDTLDAMVEEINNFIAEVPLHDDMVIIGIEAS